ncbi:MAG: RNA methyltransferase [Ruminococcus sp.]|uniref:TrmH family RNA methyltransferase n=1 Tax=Ruminococcus sp. TaxID=41978 RepID=UPI002872B257|nr:RNA methyltransferase [Ruminococcus sp.]MBQ3284949.1 RNA methyltransferase [Ruminococcus sp.]
MELISSKENKKIKYLKKLSSSASFRREEDVFTVEGTRLCADAVKSGAEIVSAFFSETFVGKHGVFVDKARQNAGEAFVLRDSLFSSVSDTKTPQGVLFVIKRLDKSLDFDRIKDNGKVLALETVQDPVNLGTILRTAEAFGIGAVVLTRDCCDIYSPKAARGSMGAVFRLPFMITDDLPAFIEDFNAFGTSYAAVLDKDSVSLNDCSFEGAALAVVGNEGNGLTPDTVKACTHKLYIPMSGKAESLNVSAAAAIILWEMNR